MTPLLGIDDALGGLGSRANAGGRERLGAMDAHIRQMPELFLDEAAAKALFGGGGNCGAARRDMRRLSRGLDPGDLSPPFALKGLGFAHKSEAGAVRLNIDDAGRSAANGTRAIGLFT